MRALVRLDADGVMARLRLRQEEMIQLFSRLRDRAPLLGTLETHFTSIRFGELVLLPPPEQIALHRFHDLLAELRWYFQYTTDMPLTVQTTVKLRLKAIEEAYGVLEALLAVPPPEERAIEVKPKRRALPGARKKTGRSR